MGTLIQGSRLSMSRFNHQGIMLSLETSAFHRPSKMLFLSLLDKTQLRQPSKPSGESHIMPSVPLVKDMFKHLIKRATAIILMSIFLLSMDSRFSSIRISRSPSSPPRGRSLSTYQVTTLLRSTLPKPGWCTVEQHSLLKKRAILMEAPVDSVVTTTRI